MVQTLVMKMGMRAGFKENKPMAERREKTRVVMQKNR